MGSTAAGDPTQTGLFRSTVPQICPASTTCQIFDITPDITMPIGFQETATFTVSISPRAGAAADYGDLFDEWQCGFGERLHPQRHAWAGDNSNGLILQHGCSDKHENEQRQAHCHEEPDQLRPELHRDQLRKSERHRHSEVKLQTPAIRLSLLRRRQVLPCSPFRTGCCHP